MPASQFDPTPLLPPWRHLFVGRSSEVSTALQHIGTDVHQNPEGARKPLLTFHGISGIGKSALRIAIAGEILKRNETGIQQIKIVECDVDSPRYTPDYAVFDLFGKVIYPALKRSRISASFFLVYYIAWASTIREHSAISRSSILSELLGKGQEVTDAASNNEDLLREDWSEAFGVAAELLAGAKLVAKALELAKIKAAERKFRSKFWQLDLNNLTVKEFESYAPLVLASDIQEYFGRSTNVNKKLCMIFDGFERIQDLDKGKGAEAAIQQFCANLSLGNISEHCRFIIFSRHELRWDEFFPSRQSSVLWRDLTTSIKLSGLDSAEADSLVTACEHWYETTDEAGVRVAQQLRKYRREILQAAAEDKPSTHQTQDCSIHPFALTLAVEQVATHVDNFNVSMLGGSASEMRESFLRYLGKSERALLEVLCVLREFSSDEFRILLEEHLITAVTVQDFCTITRDGRFCILPTNNPQYFRVHHLLSETVLSQLLVSGQDERMLTVMRTVLDRLLSSFDGTLNADTSVLERRVQSILLLLEHYEGLSKPHPEEWIKWISALDVGVPVWFALPSLITAYLRYGIAHGPNGRHEWFDPVVYVTGLARALELIVIHQDYDTGIDLSKYLLEFLEKIPDLPVEFVRATTLASRATCFQRTAQVSLAEPLLRELITTRSNWFSGKNIRRTMLAARIAHCIGTFSPSEALEFLDGIADSLSSSLDASESQQHKYLIQVARMHIALAAHRADEALKSYVSLENDDLLFMSTDPLTSAREAATGAEVLLVNGYPEKAWAMAEKAVRLVDSTDLSSLAFKAEVYEKSGRVARHLENQSFALKLLKAALAMLEEADGVNSYLTVPCRTQLAFCLAAIQKFDHATELLALNVKIMEAHLGKMHLEVATALVNQANVMANAGTKPTILEPLYHRALKIADANKNQSGFTIGVIYVNWGTFLYEQYKFEAAANYLKKGIGYLRKVPGYGEGHLAKSLFNLAAIRWKFGDQPKARALLLEARNHVVRYKGTQSNELMMIDEHLRRVSASGGKDC